MKETPQSPEKPVEPKEPPKEHPMVTDLLNSIKIITNEFAIANGIKPPYTK